MATFSLILLLAIAVLLSSLLEQMLPKISLPLVQIALGVIIALLAVAPIDVTLNPDFFLILFIAPLLFYEAKEADKFGLWRNRNMILSLALGLVVAIMLAVGFCVHALVPSIPLAAAFALGAALGPTDAVAVSSLSGSAQLGRKENAWLSGEALINDASGVVTFQFAVAAVVTGSFSVLGATTTFLIEFFGGIALGLAMGFLAHLIGRVAAKYDLSTIVSNVLFDVTLPFIIFLASEVVHVSGILAVVAAGILISMITDRRIGPNQSSINIVTDNVWKVISFALNGIVFVLLGMQLPKAMRDTWDDVAISNLNLLGYVTLITAILVGVRFLWIVASSLLIKDPETGARRKLSRELAKSCLISTIGGPKGAFTLSVIFSTPFYTSAGAAFPQRDLLIFLASGTILFTLVLANFLLPALAPAQKKHYEDSEEEAQASVQILRNVIDRLNAETNQKNALAVQTVVASYSKRVDMFLRHADMETESTNKLRLEVIRHQEEYVLGLMDANEVDDLDGYDYLHKLTKVIPYLQHRRGNGKWISYVLRHGSRTTMVLRRYIRRLTERSFTKEGITSSTELQIKAEREAIRYISRYVDNPDSPYPAEVVSEVMLAYQQGLRSLLERRPSVTAYTRASDQSVDVQRRAYNYELEEIHNAVERGDIKRSTAAKMRDNVYLMLVDLDAEMA